MRNVMFVVVGIAWSGSAHAQDSGGTGVPTWEAGGTALPTWEFETGDLERTLRGHTRTNANTQTPSTA